MKKEIMHFNHKYNIGDFVYHATPDSDKGIIIDISFSVRHNAVKYEVLFGRRSEDDVWCYEEELTTEKTF